MASISDTVQAIDAAARASGFQCCPVSWEDAQRGTVGGALSCWGGNISDVRLWEKGGKLLYTLRSQNWNERLGYVSSKDVAVVTGNHVAGGGAPPTARTLQSYLQSFGNFAAYAGVTAPSLYDADVDTLFTIRFQTVFLPIAGDEATEFCTEVYNYNTMSDDDPRNTLMLVTPQGTSVQQDGKGAKRVYYHTVAPSGSVHRYWLEGERSQHKVGGAQTETAEEAQAAAARGKATSIHIGTRAMGTRFNVQMLVQVPLKQKPRPPPPQGQGFGFCFGAPKAKASAPGCKGGGMPMDEGMQMDFFCSAPPCSAPPCPAPPAPSSFSFGRARCAPPPPAVGVSNAARVSRGSEVDTWSGVANKQPARDASQHGTITVTMYYTVAGGVPSAADVEAAIADLNALYESCPKDKRLADCGEVTKELTVKDTQDINAKITSQPYTPPPMPPANNGGGFPL